MHRLGRFAHLFQARTGAEGGILGEQGYRMVGRLVESLAEKMTELRVQQLANTAWSFARLLVRHEPLWDAISASSMPNLR
mmetsp:Transcript_120997/g.304269  ORF Transcript_120997/g.304269 Transcript_120997/m.304269 type:complete len:80 (-) Transcript_120997:22-261(-)